jgi:hypothetical protein
LLFIVAIVFSQCFVVFCQFVFNVFQVAVYFLLVEVVLFAVLCTEFSAVTGNEFSSD